MSIYFKANLYLLNPKQGKLSKNILNKNFVQ